MPNSNFTKERRMHEHLWTYFVYIIIYVYIYLYISLYEKFFTGKCSETNGKKLIK